MSDRDASRPILILLADRFADWETSLIAGAGRSFYGAEVRMASPDGGDVTSMGGLQATGLDRFAPAGNEVVVVCGGAGWEAEGASDLIRRIAPLLQQAQRDGAIIAGICGGVRVLADAGLLAGRRHTSNGRDWIDHVSPGYAGAELHVDQPEALRDGDIITAAGTAPASFAAEVLGAAGVAAAPLADFRAMLAAEHRG